MGQALKYPPEGPPAGSPDTLVSTSKIPDGEMGVNEFFQIDYMCLSGKCLCGGKNREEHLINYGG
jgi:hypothetical protein